MPTEYARMKERLQADRSIHDTLRYAIAAFDRADPVDALNDAQTLLMLMGKRFDLNGKLIAEAPLDGFAPTLVYFGAGNVYCAMPARGGAFLISAAIHTDGNFSRSLDDWTEVDHDAEPHDEIVRAKSALGVPITNLFDLL